MKNLQKTIKVRSAAMLLLMVAFVVTLGMPSRVGQAAGDDDPILPKKIAGEIEILYPTGGETWIAGTYQTIRWAGDAEICAVLRYTEDEGLDWKNITTAGCIPTDDPEWGNLGWIIPESLAGQTIQIKINDYANSDFSDISGPIEILAGEIGIEILYPTGVETWVAGTSRTIRWAGDDKVCAVLNYTEDEGFSWEEITSHCIKSEDPEWGNFAWTIPGKLAGKTIKIKIYDGLEPDSIVSSGPVKIEVSGCSVSMMPLGDCITWGNGSEKGDGYRRLLSASLTEQGYIVDFVGSGSAPWDADFDNDHEGHTGETTGYFTDSPDGKQSRLTGYLEENPPDIVLLHIGTMDIAYGYEVEEIAERIDDMLTDIYNYDKEIMVVLARIITSLDTDSAGKTEILNKKIQEVADERRVNGDKILVVDMEEALIPEDPNDPKNMYFSDSMHPNDAGYEKMARAWLHVLEPYLSEYCVQGGDWVDMGTVNDTVPPDLGRAYDPALALSPNGTPYVAWTDHDSYGGGNGEIYLKEWQSWSWVETVEGTAQGGGVSNMPDDSMLAALTVASDGSPIVAWEERKEKTSEIYARWWKDGAWKELGSVSGDSGSAFPGAATRPALAYSQDLGPIVAWHNYHTWQEKGKTKGAYAIYVKHWDGDSWEEIGSGSASGIGVNRSYENAFTPSLAIHKQDIYIAWANEIAGGTSQIYVKYWNGRHWIELGDSAHFGGVSKTLGGDSWRPSLAVDPYTWQLVVAWEDNSRGNYEIYLKKWNNNYDVQAWEEMDGSASGGGISVTDMDSKWPSLAIGSDGLPVVTWQEETFWSEVYGKRWDGDSWEGMGGSAFGGGISDCGAVTSKPSLAVGASGAPIVAFHCGIAGDYHVYVRRWQAASPPSPPPPDGPYLVINHQLGAPDSFFTLSGSDFPAGKEAAVTVNRHDMGTVAVNSEGAFEFVLSTAGADEGHYVVTASVNPSASAQFALAAGEPVWPQEGTGPVMEVPAGIAFMERLFLPVCAR